jgi:hypothetical protein
MFRYVGDHSDALQPSSNEILEDSVVSLISKVGINLPMSDKNYKIDENLNHTIFEITQRGCKK